MDSARYNIQVSVETQYIEKESDPEHNRYVFAYTVTIVNQGSVGAKLLSRHWIISDAEGNSHHCEYRAHLVRTNCAKRDEQSFFYFSQEVHSDSS